MRKSIGCLLCLAVLAIHSHPVVSGSCEEARKGTAPSLQLLVAVSHELKLDRLNETIVLDWKALTTRLPALKPDYILVKDIASGKPVVSQSVDTNGDGSVDELIFQSDFAAREPTKVFLIEASNERLPVAESKVFARYVPERADDFAWENDRIAFRTYGKALEPTLVSSGIDVWTKRTRHLIINKWYKAGEEYYHKDTGEGLDMYSVKLSRGCGGSGIWDGKRLHISRNYQSWKVIANGPIRAIFELMYNPWDVNGMAVSEVKRITLDAGQNLNQIDSTLTFDGKDQPINLALGIARQDGWKGTTDFSKENGWFSRWDVSETNGSLGCAVVADPQDIVGLADDELNRLVIVRAQSGKPIRYYTGAGWDKSGDFANKGAWNKYLDNVAKRRQSPLKIAFLSKPPQGNGVVQSWSKKVASSVLTADPNPEKLHIPGWRYDTVFLLSSLLALWQRDNDPRYFQYVKDWVNLYVNDDGIIDQRAYHRDDYELDSLLAGRLLMRLYQVGKEEKYKKAAYFLIEQLQQQPRTQERGFWHKKVYAHQMWLDGIYMAGPYSVEFARAFNEPRWFDETAHQMTLIYQHTRDPQTGLLYHGWDESKTQSWANPQTGASPEFWGRAMGWYMMALVDVLDDFPKNRPKRDELIKILQDLSARLVKYQNPQTGLWYQVIDKGDRPDNWHETSASAMFVYSLAKGVRNGYLGGKYAGIARKAYQGLLDHHMYLDETGRVYFTGTVYVGTLNPKVSTGDYHSYVNTARQVNDLKGVAAFLWASLEMERNRPSATARHE
jgi:rhamnogalacturonyl hydrolase YesR